MERREEVVKCVGNDHVVIRRHEKSHYDAAEARSYKTTQIKLWNNYFSAGTSKPIKKFVRKNYLLELDIVWRTRRWGLAS